MRSAHLAQHSRPIYPHGLCGRLPSHLYCHLPVAFRLSIELMLICAYAYNHCARRRAGETGAVLHLNHGEGSSRKRSAHASCPQQSSSAASVSRRKRSGGRSRAAAQDKRLILVDTSVWIDHLRSADAETEVTVTE